MKKASDHRRVMIIAFVVYTLFLVYFLFFSEYLGRVDRGSESPSYNLILFKEIRRFLTYRDQVGVKAVFLNIYGNILAFMPFGFLLPVLVRRKNAPVTICAGFLFSLLIEFIQFKTAVGSFDVDDIFLNTCGVILGYIIYALVHRLIRKKHG